jgi:hypothetical protein
VTTEAGTGRRLFLPIKNNVGQDRLGYSSEIQNRVVGDGIRNTSAVVWSSDSVTIPADEALAATAKKSTPGAVAFLQEALREGPMDHAEIARLAKEAGITEKSLRTARERLGVTPRKEGFGANGKWVWVPAGSATVLRLVVDNEAKKKITSGKATTEAGDTSVTTVATTIDQAIRSERPDAPGGDDVA